MSAEPQDSKLEGIGVGDITTAGTLTCLQCGQTLQLKRTSLIPPCPACSGTQYRKAY